MIPEPQLTYLLELLQAIGPAADDFVVAGAQAMKFAVEKARGTKDVDFLLNVLALRKEPLQLAPIFERLGYAPAPESRNFQFEKPIPGSNSVRSIAAPTFEGGNGMGNHTHVKNPKELTQEAKNRRRHDNRFLYYNDVVLEWIPRSRHSDTQDGDDGGNYRSTGIAGASTFRRWSILATEGTTF
jgi:hypothetical protein